MAELARDFLVQPVQVNRGNGGKRMVLGMIIPIPQEESHERARRYASGVEPGIAIVAAPVVLRQAREEHDGGTKEEGEPIGQQHPLGRDDRRDDRDEKP